jgi:hypothetical protein
MWQRRASLTDWTIEVRIVEKLRVERRPANAGTSCVDQRARVEFDQDFLLGCDSNQLDHAICHELGHVIGDAQERVWVKYLSQSGVVYREWADANEQACDHFATILVEAYKRKRDRHSK